MGICGSTLVKEGEREPLREKHPDKVQDYICPITVAIMRDPVTAADGHTYERDAIEKYIEEHREHAEQVLSPVTGIELEHFNLKPAPGSASTSSDVAISSGQFNPETPHDLDEMYTNGQFDSLEDETFIEQEQIEEAKNRSENDLSLIELASRTVTEGINQDRLEQAILDSMGVATDASENRFSLFFDHGTTENVDGGISLNGASSSSSSSNTTFESKHTKKS
jgi:hypothetical protein